MEAMNYLSSVKSLAVRKASLNGRACLVAPLTMIVQGVLNGSEGAMYYPGEELARDPEAWNGMPIVKGHPVLGGNPVSARDPKVLEELQLGTVFRARAEVGNKSKLVKLKAQGWFDAEKTKRIAPEIYQALLEGRPVELSTGLFTSSEDAPEGAEFRGKPYVKIARQHRPDHLAILIGEKGACSVQDGCGLNVNLGRYGNPQSKSTGRFKRHGAGTGRGEAHEAAQRGFMVLSDRDKQLGESAAKQKKQGKNPPSWVMDKSTWERAKEAADKGGYESDSYWAVVAHIYQRMGGGVAVGPVVAKEKDMAEVAEQAAKKQLIEWLTSNCNCWKGKSKVLESISRQDLAELKSMVENNRKLMLIVNGAKGKPTLSEGEEVEVDIPALAELLGVTAEPASDPVAFVKEITTKLSSVLAKLGVAPAQPENELPREEEEEEEEEEGLEEKEKKPNNNTFSIQQWLKAAPPQVQAAWNHAAKLHQNEHRRLVELLSSRMVGNSKKAAKVYSSMSLEQLQTLAEGLQERNSEEATADVAMTLFGGTMVANDYEEDQEDILPDPVINYGEKTRTA